MKYPLMISAFVVACAACSPASDTEYVESDYQEPVAAEPAVDEAAEAATNAWNGVITRIGYTNITRNYLNTAAGVNSPSTLVEATTVLGFDKFISDLSKRASSFKLTNNQTEAFKPSFPMVSNRRLKAFRMYLEWQVLMEAPIDDRVDANNFDEDEMVRWRNRIVFLEEETSLTSDDSWNFTHDDVPHLDGFNK